MLHTHFKTVLTCCIIILAVCAALWDKVIFAIPLVIVGLAYCYYKKYSGKIFSIILFLIFIITCLYAQTREPKQDVLTYYDGKGVILEGVVSSFPSKSLQNKTKFSFDAKYLTDENGNKKEVKARTLAFLNRENETEISRGNYLKIKANILIPKNFSNEGEFDYAKYLANSNTFTISFVDELQAININPSLTNKVLRYIDKIREEIIIKHKKYLPQNKMEILGGVVFGSEAIKPAPELKNMFIESGLYHLLAASGMNVAFIFGIWFFIFIRLKVPYKFVIISGGIVVFFYALMTGLPPSVTRATWMLELGLLGKLIERKSDNNVILLFICAILLLYNPMLLNDIGFLLSFMVTFGLINFSTPLMDAIKFIPAKISGWFLIPFIAQVFAAPIQMYYFQTISLYSIFANMLVVPFMAIISFCGFISSIFALIPKIGSALCFCLDKINEPFLTFMYFVAEKFSAIPNNLATVPKINALEIFLYYVLVFLLLYLIKNKFKNIKIIITTFVILVFLILSFTFKGYNKDLNITFLNVGEGDSIFIQTPNNKKILVDTGRIYGKTRNSGASVILPFFKINNINHLDMLILSHPDTDHIAGSIDIFKNIKVDKFITNGEKAENKSYKDLMTYIKTNNIKENKITVLTEISPDKDMSIIAIKPPDTISHSQNDTSLILFIKYKNFDGILMGDNETNSFELLKQTLKSNGRVELFKIGHHGSKEAINSEMAKFIAPEVTTISVGENTYGHPNEESLEILKDSKIFRTDFDNTIKIKTNGINYKVYTYNYQKSRWKISE